MVGTPATPATAAPGRDGTAQALDGLAATFALCLAVLMAGLAALYQATAGGTAYTTETLRRSEVALAPLPVPDFRVIDAQGREQPLRELLASDGRVWIVDFVYTRCATLCLSLGTVFQQLQAQVLAQGLQDRVGLLSISFDPEHDRPPALATYARRMGMQPEAWQLVSLAEPADRRRLLDSFGIMVVPAPLGEFEHNAALHLVTPEGELVRILGLDEGVRALRLAQAWAEPVPAVQAAQATPSPRAP
jgi:protein SCO1/2